MTGSPAPAGQEAAPAAGLRFRRSDLFRKFIAWLFLVDSWIIRWPDNRDHGRDRRSIRFAEIGAGTEQRRCRDLRRFGWRRCRLGGRCRRWLGGCRGRSIVLRRRWRRQLARRLVRRRGLTFGGTFGTPRRCVGRSTNGASAARARANSAASIAARATASAPSI